LVPGRRKTSQRSLQKTGSLSFLVLYL
jgi:hypothetical protein